MITSKDQPPSAYFKCLAFLLMLVYGHGHADESRLTINSVEVGFGGVYQVGQWTPVTINFNSQQDFLGTLGITVIDGEGVNATTTYKQQVIEAGNSSLQAYAKFGRTQSEMSVAFKGEHQDQTRHVHSTFQIAGLSALPSQHHLIVALGDDLDLKGGLKKRKSASAEKTSLAVVTSLSALPDHWIGYSGVELLFLPTRNEEIFKLSLQQSAAIVDFVKHGGQIVFSVAENAPQLIRSKGPFAELVPGVFESVVKIRSTSGLEEFIGTASTRLDQSLNRDDFDFPVAKINEMTGTIIVEEGLSADKRPTIVTQALGLGQVIFVAFDLDSELLEQWSDRPAFMNRLIDISLGETVLNDDRDSTSVMTRSGYDDLTGQLRSALEQFPNAKHIPFSIVAFLIIVYLLLIGPIDYYLLSRFKRRFVWTWISFPLLVLLFCGIAYGITSFTRSKNIELNRFSIVDVDLTDGRAQAVSWFNLFSPKSHKFNLTIEPQLAGIEKTEVAALTWQGLPGSGFGAMNSGLESNSKNGYRIDVQRNPEGHFHAQLTDLPIMGNSSRSLVGRWTAKLDADVLSDNSRLLQGLENQLSGVIANPLSIDLYECILVHDRWTYQLGNLRAQGSKDLHGINAREIKTYLTRQEFVDGRFKTSPWDREGTDLGKIGRMMMFYRSIGGRSYTNLLHHYQSRIDCSHMLNQDRAFLVGNSDVAPDVLLRDGQPIQATGKKPIFFYRINIPVTPRK